MSTSFIKKDRGAHKTLQGGLSLIEVIVGAAIIASSIVSVMGIYGGLSQLSYRNTARIQAALLLEEGTEALKVMRDSSWTNNIATLSTATTYRFEWSTSTATWLATTTGLALIDGVFDRSFTVSNVNRDAGFNIVSSGGTLDSGSKNVTVTVSWLDGNATTTRSLNTYIFNSFNN